MQRSRACKGQLSQEHQQTAARHTRNPPAQMLHGYPQSKGRLHVGRREVAAWKDTRAQMSVIHQSLEDPKFIDSEVLVTIQPFKTDPFHLPTDKLLVKYKDWSGTWTFAVYDDYLIPMLVEGDLANHVNQAKRVGVVTRSKIKQASTSKTIPEPTRDQPMHPDTSAPEVMEPDPRLATTTASVDPVPELQVELAHDLEQVEQLVPGLEPAAEGATETAAESVQQAPLEPATQASAPAETGSPPVEVPTSPASLPEGPSLMSPASRESSGQNRKKMRASRELGWRAEVNHHLSALLIGPGLR
nr:uncharacterized protein LOC102458571 [Pelodiscus sinensis]XP_006136282.1 uncharacterized protein LOC102458571 [Pelodiscus sinensis]|eukprot:XP_006136281.1 uncharacterized protein LOC102458571 [Pelodiscus sinensis]